MDILALVLFLVAAVVFVIETVRTHSLIAAGLACMALAFAVPGLAAV